MPGPKRNSPKSKPSKKAGARRGRPPAGTPSKSDQIRQLLGTGMAPMDIAKKVGATPGLVYVVKSKMGGGGKAKRGPGRPRKVASPANTGLGGILTAVQQTERERIELRRMLEQMREMVMRALG